MDRGRNRGSKVHDRGVRDHGIQGTGFGYTVRPDVPEPTIVKLPGQGNGSHTVGIRLEHHHHLGGRGIGLQLFRVPVNPVQVHEHLETLRCTIPQ